MRTLLALQAWTGDLDRAVELSKFWCELHGERSQSVDLMLVCRYDCDIPVGWTEEMSRSFRARAVKSNRIGQGWPEGCNQLWMSTVEHALSMAREGNEYDAIVTFEADSVPVKRDWIARLTDELAASQADVMGAYMAGHDVAANKHINGNMVISGRLEFLEWLCSLFQNPVGTAWDVWIWPRLSTRKWHSTKQIFNCWNSKTIDEGAVQSWATRGVAVIHGVKDRSCLEAARRMLL